jgi:tetratricopeptide (TPR) repeat protein
MRALLVVVLTLSLWAELPPQGVTVSQWVREDIFAGMLGNDLATFEKGMAKTRELLSVDPNNDEARAWLAGGQVYLATRTYKSGNPEKGSSQLAEAIGNAHQALAKKDPSAMRILAGSFVLNADRFPEEQKMALLKDGRSLFAMVRKQEDSRLDHLPEHFKAEVLAGQAQAAMRLGLQEEATKYLNEIVAKLPNTHYAATAEKWLADPASSSKSQLVCQSCHEPNRLANRLKAIAAK